MVGWRKHWHASVNVSTLHFDAVQAPQFVATATPESVRLTRFAVGINTVINTGVNAVYVDPINRRANAPALVRFSRFPSSLITLNEPEQLTGLLRAQGPDRALPFGWDLGCNPSPRWMILL